jgi:hypothetical protein
MNEKELIGWLMDNGGSAIKFRTATELMDNYPQSQRNKLAEQLLENRRAKTLLPLLDNFPPVPSFDNIREFTKIHTSKSSGIEGIMPRLLHMGFRQGIPAFDRRMRKFRKYVDNDLVKKALDNAKDPYVNDVWALFSAVLLASYFIWGGYRYDESVRIIKRQIDLVYRTASGKIFDIYLPEEEFKAKHLSPQKKMRKLVLKPGIQFPLIFDIFGLAYLPDDLLDGEVKRKINTIVRYMLDEKFQSLHEGYGYLYFKSNQRKAYNFYGCGWRPVLPYSYGFDSDRHKRTIVLYLDLMSHFKPAVQSDWFKKCLNHLEQFQTPSGTYCFPSNYLMDKKEGFYVLGGMMGLEDKRAKKSLELESTFWMLLIKKRMRQMNR